VPDDETPAFEDVPAFEDLPAHETPADVSLLADLRRIAGIVDAPPPLLVSSSRAAFAFGRLDDELARVVQDTAVQPVGSRGVDDPRMIAFAADEITVDVEVTGGPDDHRLTGVVDGEITRLGVQTPAATHPVEVDEQGRFRAAHLEGSLLRLTLTTRAGRGVTTPWVRLDF
jgi:hypothetical protein